MNLTELLELSGRAWPDKPALIDGETVMSYSELVAEVSRLGAKLREIGVAPGSRIGLACPNSISYVVLTYALWQAEAVVVPIPTECTPDESAEITEMMQVEGMISPQPMEGALGLSGEAWFKRVPAKERANNHGLNLAFIRFTSGTTSARKGVALSHETIRDRILAANHSFKIVPEDTVIWCLPMAHHFLITIVLYLSEGATVVLARHTVARPFLDAANRWKGTVLYAAPFHFAMLARDNSELKLPSVRLAVSTTCALPESVARDFLKRFELPLAQAFGVIELGLVSLNTDDSGGRWNSVGRPSGTLKVRIHNPDAEGCGEVAVAGPGIFDAYAAPWAPREMLLRDGWFFTGDIGRTDAEGFLFLLTRKTAVINLAGRKVFPEEIEAVLNRHPEVVESRVYGRPHPHLGEVVEAELVLKHAGADLNSVRAFCRDHLASYKIPTRLSVLEALPRTAVTGKLVRTPVETREPKTEKIQA
jgi:long-chain acyl-CoA synthetase